MPKPRAADDDMEDTTNHAGNGESKPAKAPKAKKTAKPKAAKAGKPAKAKAEKGPKKVDLKTLEASLIKKYPKQEIIPGSLKDSGAMADFGNKRTIVIRCQGDDCNATRRIATSDLHQTRNCEKCIKEIRMEARRSSRKSKPKKKAKKAS
jgi:hypothetical protein